MTPLPPHTTTAEHEAERQAIRELIRAQLAATPLRLGQIDVNGKCNAKCWYCPVKY